MKPAELRSATLSKLITPIVDRTGLAESASFLVWFLENVYRLEETEARDAVCDHANDKGIDGIYIDHTTDRRDPLSRAKFARVQIRRSVTLEHQPHGFRRPVLHQRQSQGDTRRQRGRRAEAAHYSHSARGYGGGPGLLANWRLRNQRIVEPPRTRAPTRRSPQTSAYSTIASR